MLDLSIFDDCLFELPRLGETIKPAVKILTNNFDYYTRELMLEILNEAVEL